MDERCTPRLCVLSSGSSGNCAVLRYDDAGRTRTVLIDAGLSPRRTRELLDGRGLALDEVDAVVLTHMDTDHWHPGWARGWGRWMRPGAALLVHESHASVARRDGPSPHGAFAERLDLPGGARATCRLLAHDSEGVASFRFELPGESSADLGWVTDAGRVTDELIDAMRGVAVLGIESNYCPRLQASSGRPHFLIRRVTGGAGHLSNEECLEAIERIRPTEHVLLLHLSAECNRPELVADLHAGADYALTIAPRREPTRWVAVARQAPRVRIAADATHAPRIGADTPG